MHSTKTGWICTLVVLLAACTPTQTAVSRVRHVLLEKILYNLTSVEVENAKHSP